MHAQTSATQIKGFSTPLAVIIALAIVLACFAWTQGTFDNFLWKVGLNYNECGTNGFGATFCGDELKEYNLRIEKATR